jgi:hypothetical protein
MARTVASRLYASKHKPIEQSARSFVAEAEAMLSKPQKQTDTKGHTALNRNLW